MINNISGSGNIIVTGGSSFMPFVNMSNPSAGMVRYNGNNQCIEVYDGLTWLTMNSNHVGIGLTDTANAAISWVMNKMAEEKDLEELSKKNPAVEAAYNNFKKAEEQLKTTIILSKETSEKIQYHPV